MILFIKTVTMKFTSVTVLSALAAISCSSTTVSAFSPTVPSFVNKQAAASSSSTALQYSVGIVGATGAVGKEIRSVLETRNKLAVDTLRIFGSERSAGTTVNTQYGDVTGAAMVE